VAINFVSLWREDGYLEGEHLPVRQEGMTIVTRYLSRSSQRTRSRRDRGLAV